MSAREQHVRRPILARPPLLRSGEVLCELPVSAVKKREEMALTRIFTSQRRLFGMGYQVLLPRYFDEMRAGSGVFIAHFLPIHAISPETNFPGDIDLLVVPYEGDELVLSMALAIEIKVVRASFAKQGKSPNQFGFSQAQALLRCGFPYAAVVHLVVSDESPKHAHRPVYTTRVLDEEGRCEPPVASVADLLPADLVQRAIGRLEANRDVREIGLLATYLSTSGLWMPSGRQCQPNPGVSTKLLVAIYEYFSRNPFEFFDTPKY